jgi:PAS domain S-box-containing protein
MKSLSQKQLPQLLTLSQVSKVLNVHPNTLRLWDKNGLLTPIRIGTRQTRRYYLDDVMKLINQENQNGRTQEVKITDDLTKDLARFKAIVESSDDAIIGKTLEGIITSWNPAAEKLYGYSVKEAVGQHISVIFPKELYPEFEHIMQSIRHGIPIDRHPTTRVTKNGKRVHVSVTISPIRDKRGTIVGASTIARDITEKVETKDKLQFLSILTQNIADAVIGTDEKYHIVSWNKGAEQMYGWKEEEVLGKPSKKVLKTQFTRSGDEKEWRKAFKTSGQWRGEVMQYKKDGTVVNVLASVAVVKDQDGNIVGGIGVNRDISERVQIEHNLRFLSKASKVLSSSLDYEKTLRTIAHLAVPRIADWCGIDLLIEDGSISQVGVAHKDPKKIKWAKELRQKYPVDMTASTGVSHVLKTGKAEYYPYISDDMLVATARSEEELELARKIGFTSAILVPLCLQTKCIGVITFVTAETKRRFTPADLAMAEEVASRAALAIQNARLFSEAKQAVQMRDDFISIASHELKTPITSLKVYAEVLKKQLVLPGVSSDASRFLERINTQVDKLTGLIHDLLDVSKVQRGKLEFRKEPVSLEEIIVDSVDTISHTSPKHTIYIEGTIKKQIYGDKDRLGQVITNLLTNAIKYSPRGKKIIVTLSQEKEYAKVSVKDFGIGIAKTHQEKIFGRFYRVSDVAEKTFPGLGIGLYISNEIIKRHNGQMQVQSAKGKGSIFSFTLPYNSTEKPT